MPKPGPAARSCALTLLLLASSSLPAAEDAGKKIYTQKCATCHGPTGQGVKGKYSKLLIGDKSVQQLTAAIAKTMPEDNPGTCVGADAEAVAKYIYDAFYSPTAQARNKPARIDVSRLTINQYRNSLADLFGAFR